MNESINEIQCSQMEVIDSFFLSFFWLALSKAHSYDKL